MGALPPPPSSWRWLPIAVGAAAAAAVAARLLPGALESAAETLRAWRAGQAAVAAVASGWIWLASLG